MQTMKQQDKIVECEPGYNTRQHYRLLGHQGYGVSELRIFDPKPRDAYVDNEEDAVRLWQEVSEICSGIYVGVQPRPAHFHDLAPNCWRPAQSAPVSNCACDSDIEYITMVYFDIDVISDARRAGYPASEEELKQSLQAAELLSREEGLAMSSVIGYTGNGHCVLAPLVPVPVDSDEVANKFKYFCQELAKKIASQVSGVKIDPVYNLSRVMRLMGTWNRKGQPIPGRPHRRAHFVTELPMGRSMALHHMILNTDVDQFGTSSERLPQSIRCDLCKLEHCEFIKWCRCNAKEVSEPLWWAMITNLAHLEGGIELIHEISRLDPVRYDYADTQYKIQKAIDAGYRPVSCKTIASEAMTCAGRGKFQCSRILKCRAKAPMYMTVSHTVYTR
jgi:hypothetical protein